MKKFILILLLCLFLVGCDSKDQEGNNSTTDEPTIETPVVSEPVVEPTPTPETIDISMVTLADLSVYYDGNEHYLECSNVPENVYVDYENNFQTEVGTYTVVAILTDEFGNELGRLEAILEIKKVKVAIDISGVTLADLVVEFDGKIHSIACENVPEGVFVTYDGNDVSEVGTYPVIAILKDSEGNELGRINAVITIKEKKVIDISMVELPEKIVNYDGSKHYLECTNIPEGVVVTYEGNGVSEVGTHLVVAILKDLEDNELGRLEANIVINEVETPIIILSTPELSIDELGNVSWNEVDGATHYNYIINNGDVKTLTLFTIKLEDAQTIAVQAANDELVSEWSYAVTYYKETTKYEEAPHDIYVKFHNASLSTIKLTSGNTVDRPSDPVKANYTFDNWYADPFYQELFDFNTALYENTVIYANYIPTDLVENTYFWIKGSPMMSATIMSGGTASDWHFIPLKVNENNTTFKEFYATVTVTGATTTLPCAFIVMDGFSDDSGRTYWKNGSNDFTINSDGVYNIYFSTEHQYASGIHIYVEQATNSAVNLAYAHLALDLDIPVVSVDSTVDIANWDKVEGAIGYEVIINNAKAIYTTALSVDLAKGSYITVRAISNDKYSRWSLPKANYNISYVEDSIDSYSVYFTGYNAYQVIPNEVVTAPENPEKDGFSFGGWYLDYNCTRAAQFPYTITENTVFYPKWVANDDYANKVYYNLVLENGTVVKGLTWNLDNYTFDEYETGMVTLEANTNYYIVSTSKENIKYGPYTVETKGGYQLYFSEDYLWDGKNVYIAATTKTIYVTNNKRWTDTLYAYVWNSSSNTPAAVWPGVALTFVETNGYGEDIYKFEVDLSLYDMIVLSHGTMTNGSYKLSSQTIDLKLSDYESTNAFYFTEKDSNGKYKVGTWNK